jgi:PleD family two-component response regulator
MRASRTSLRSSMHHVTVERIFLFLPYSTLYFIEDLTSKMENMYRMAQLAFSKGLDRRGSVVLVADDTPMIKDNVLVPLQQHQIHVIVTSDAKDALILICNEPPALVLINEELPDLDGYHLCQLLHKNAHLQDLPLLLLLKKKEAFEPQQTLRVRLAGATASLTLPMDPDEFVQTVKKYLNEGM